MKKEIPVKIIELRNEIYKDIYDKNRWVYVKMQALLEFVTKYFCSTNLYYSDYDSDSNIERILNISDSLGIPSDITSHFKRVNYLANIVKHSADDDVLEETKFDAKITELFISKFNTYCHYLFDNKGKIFELDSPTINANKLGKIDVKASDEYSKNRNTATVRPKEQKTIDIYCGVGKQDYGFRIHNIVIGKACGLKDASIYAVIYNLLQRSLLVKKTLFLKRHEAREKILRNYMNIYRYEMILLVLIKNNYFNENRLNVTTQDGDINEIKLAVEEINWFAEMISTLMNIDFQPLVLIEGEVMHSISIKGDRSSSVFSIDNIQRKLGKKEFWFENTIKYDAINTLRVTACLEDLLLEIFGFSKFKPGQAEALIRILNGEDSLVTILPTGGGKSLLYYFVALLQPNSTLVVSPTEILIKDQIRNLKELHNFDDVFSLVENGIYNISSAEKIDSIDFEHLLIFVTPEKLQNRSVIMPLISQNVNNRFSSIILDEIHTISNWSHDFRPDYLMLSYNLHGHLDNARYLGFTATANYRVLKDVVTQLKIPNENVVSPIDLKRNNINFLFMHCKEKDAMLDTFHTEIQNKYKTRDNNQKTIVFTKGKNVSTRLKSTADNITKWNMDIFSDKDTFSYEGFIEGRKSILICEEEMGVGINIPMVQNVFHYGLPISKGQYVQEIGRVDRFGEGGLSVVLFKPRDSMNKYERTIIDFSTSIDEVLSLLKMLEEDDDLRLSYVKVLGHIEHYSKTANGINDLYELLRDVENCLRIQINVKDSTSILQQQVYMFFLFKMGIIHNWYIVNKDNDKIIYDIEVMENHTNLICVKRNSIEYISGLGFYSQEINEIEEAESIKEIIYIVQTWYYNQFLRYHREQYLNLIDFFEINVAQNASKDQITEQLSDYFSGSLVVNGGTEKNYVEALTIREMIETIESQPDTVIVSKIESSLENEYSSKLDLYISVYQMIVSNHLNVSRITRALNSTNESCLYDFQDNCYLLYAYLKNDTDRLEFIKMLGLFQRFDDIIENIFTRITKDKIYYAYLSKCANNQIEILKGEFVK